MIQKKLFPAGHHLRKAVQWISEQKQEQKAKPLHRIIEKAGYKFDLSPKDIDFLIRTLNQKEDPKK